MNTTEVVAAIQELQRIVTTLEVKLERNFLDRVEKDKEHSRIAELENMVTELRAANIVMAKQLDKIDRDVSNIVTDLSSVQKITVTSITPDDNYYAYLDGPVGP
jgi:DNA invertase Pin-like site-specific DNA recombinase